MRGRLCQGIYDSCGLCSGFVRILISFLTICCISGMMNWQRVWRTMSSMSSGISWTAGNRWTTCPETCFVCSQLLVATKRHVSWLCRGWRCGSRTQRWEVEHWYCKNIYMRDVFSVFHFSVLSVTLILFLCLCVQLTRPAQDLLMSLCMNCNTHGTDDMEVISNLIKIRLKPKVLLNHYMLCVRSAESLRLVSFYCNRWLTLTGLCDYPGSCSMHTETTWALW